MLSTAGEEEKTNGRDCLLSNIGSYFFHSFFVNEEILKITKKYFISFTFLLTYFLGDEKFFQNVWQQRWSNSQKSAFILSSIYSDPENPLQNNFPYPSFLSIISYCLVCRFCGWHLYHWRTWFWRLCALSKRYILKIWRLRQVKSLRKFTFEIHNERFWLNTEMKLRYTKDKFRKIFSVDEILK